MKDKLKFLTKQSLDRKINTKTFKIVNILLLCLLIFIANIDSIVHLFGGDFNEETKVYVEDHVNSYSLFEEAFSNISESFQSGNYVLEKKDNVEEFQDSLEKENIILIKLLPDDTNYVKGELISYNDVGMIAFNVIQNALSTVKDRFAISASGLSEEEISALTSPAVLEKTILNEEESSENKEMVASIVSLVIILPCFFLILLLVQMLGAEVNDEKTTRSMEIIISNVSPKTHFLSKIFAATLFVLIQGILLLVYGGLALFSRSLFSSSATSLIQTDGMMELLETVKSSGILTLFVRGLPIFIILFLSSFLLYAIVAGVLASMTTNIEDFQQLQTPMMLIIMLGYYLSLMAVQFDGAIFIKIMAFVPMLSFLLAPVLFLLGQFQMIELVISTIINVVFTWIVFHYGLRIYKVGILNYSSQKLWKKMFQSIKKNKKEI